MEHFLDSQINRIRMLLAIFISTKKYQRTGFVLQGFSKKIKIHHQAMAMFDIILNLIVFFFSFNTLTVHIDGSTKLLLPN